MVSGPRVIVRYGTGEVHSYVQASLHKLTVLGVDGPVEPDKMQGGPSPPGHHREDNTSSGTSSGKDLLAPLPPPQPTEQGRRD